MNSKYSELTLKRILQFWLPLESTWLMMALENTLLSAFIARLAEPKFNLAAYGVAFSFILVIEAPILMIISATTALVKDRDSFQKMQRFTFVLIGIITLIMALILIPPFFFYLTEHLIGLPSRIAELTYQACLILIPVPWAIGLRRFSQGLLIRHSHTRFVAFGTAIRLVSLVVIGLVFYYFSAIEGAAVGAVVLTIAVILEAVASRLMARPIIRELLKKNASEGSGESPLTYTAIFKFYLPLALTSFLALGVQPSITFFVGKSRMAIDSLAVLPVINGLVFLFMSVGLSYHEACIALLGENNLNFKKLRNFALILGAVSIILLAGIGFTPLSYLWFRLVSGLSEHLTEFALTPVKILALMPGIWVMLTFQRSILVNARHTGPITWATALELILVILTLFLAIRVLDVIGAVGATTALLVGRTGGTLCLFPSFLKILRGSKEVPSS
jgi:progressive ankylosis protein